jgi:hypothetical protein
MSGQRILLLFDLPLRTLDALVLFVLGIFFPKADCRDRCRSEPMRLDPLCPSIPLSTSLSAVFFDLISWTA